MSKKKIITDPAILEAIQWKLEKLYFVAGIEKISHIWKFDDAYEVFYYVKGVPEIQRWWVPGFQINSLVKEFLEAEQEEILKDIYED
jgi:hypothetical protein